jgi:hypothetical protein
MMREHTKKFEENELLCVGGNPDCVVFCLSHCVIHCQCGNSVGVLGRDRGQFRTRTAVLPVVR